MDYIKFDLQMFDGDETTAKTVTVNSQAELQSALNDSSVKKVIVGSNFDITSQVTVTSGTTVELDLNGKTLTATGTDWEVKKSDVFNITNGNLTVKNGRIDVDIAQGVLKEGWYDKINSNAGCTTTDYLNIFYLDNSEETNQNKAHLTLGEGFVVEIESDCAIEVTGVLIEGKASGTASDAENLSDRYEVAMKIDSGEFDNPVSSTIQRIYKESLTDAIKDNPNRGKLDIIATPDGYVSGMAYNSPKFRFQTKISK